MTPEAPVLSITPEATVVNVAPVVLETTPLAVATETFAAPVATAVAKPVEAGIDQASLAATPVAIEPTTTQASIEEATPVADAAENVAPEAVAELLPEPLALQEQAIEPALTILEPAPAQATQAADANSRAEQLRGLFDTARSSTQSVDLPVAANTEHQAETEDATRNA